MQQILVYSDSLSWGIIPTTRKRLAFDARWPGVMELTLVERGYSVRVIEDCLNGRRTVWEDPFEIHSPLSLVMLMLGTNDLQSMHPHTASGMPRPPILDPRGPIADKFTGVADKAVGLAAAYRAVAAEWDCHFFDAGSVTPASTVDGIHLDADQHEILGRSLAQFVAALSGVLTRAA